MNLRNIFSKNVKFYRYRKHLTQEKLANIMNVSTNYISRIESGKHTPTFEMTELLAHNLGIEPFELFINRNYHNLPARVDMMDKSYSEKLTSTLL